MFIEKTGPARWHVGETLPHIILSQVRAKFRGTEVVWVKLNVKHSPPDAAILMPMPLPAHVNPITPLPGCHGYAGPPLWSVALEMMWTWQSA